MDAVESADLLGSTLRRLESDVQAALRRRPAQEAHLAAITRTVAPLSSDFSRRLVSVLEMMVERGAFERPLYGAIVRTLAEGDRSGEVAGLMAQALADARGAASLSTLSAACFCRHSELGEALARAATSRHAHVAFAAEVARMTRGESNGARVTALAPKIKESSRIALCVELFAPMLGVSALPPEMAPALAVLRDSERHIGRWLVLAEMALRSGDEGPREQARKRACTGPERTRAAWSLVLWALEPERATTKTRPTVELVARLSDRPSADKDATFLFRLAGARVQSARPMLESLVRKTSMLGAENAVRAMLHLCRDYGQEQYRERLADLAKTERRDAVRGLAAACLYDAGETSQALDGAERLDQSRQLAALAWSSLIRARHAAAFADTIVTEARYRRVQLGWAE